MVGTHGSRNSKPADATSVSATESVAVLTAELVDEVAASLEGNDEEGEADAAIEDDAKPR